MTRTIAACDYINIFNRTAAAAPQSVMLRNWLTIQSKKNKLEERIRCSQLLTDECLNGTAYCTIDYIKNFVENFPVLSLCFIDKTVDRPSMTKMVRNLRQYLCLNENLGFSFECTSTLWQESVKETFDDMKTMEYFIVHPFWIPFEKHSKLKNEDFLAPAGYEFDSLKINEAELVNSLWRWKFENSVDVIRKRIESFPNVCLREIGTGRLACFELTCSENGYMTHLFTMAEHRRKGLATLVELKLAQKLLAFGICPYKGVAGENQAGLNISDKSPWWSQTGYTECWCGVATT